MAETASIYVHLDWHIGHYAKILLDEVFGEEKFRREVIWNRMNPSGGKAAAENWIHVHDTILYYSKGEDYLFNKHYISYSEEYIEKRFIHEDEKGRFRIQGNDGRKQYLKDSRGKAITSVWDLSDINVMAEEKTDYSTQKPEALLQRTIKASSDEGMIVADFFAGSGTAARVAHDVGRKFIACDVGVNAIQTTRDRLVKAGAEFDVLKVRDGVRLFRNPAQTTMRLFSLIDGWKDRLELSLSDFWDGGIAGMKGSYAPVKFIGLDKKLSKRMIDVILEEVYRLEDIGDEEGAVKIVYAYKDEEVDQHYINRELGKVGKTLLAVELVSLDDLLGEKRDMLFGQDSADIAVRKEKNGTARVEIKKYFSPYLKAKIDEYNEKRVKKGQQSIGGKSAPAGAVRISAAGLELIEAVQFDTALKKNGAWTSNLAMEDKAGVKEKIKGVYLLPAGVFKMKIRNIAGDEIILDFA